MKEMWFNGNKFRRTVGAMINDVANILKAEQQHKFTLKLKGNSEARSFLVD